MGLGSVCQVARGPGPGTVAGRGHWFWFRNWIASNCASFLLLPRTLNHLHNQTVGQVLLHAFWALIERNVFCFNQQNVFSLKSSKPPQQVAGHTGCNILYKQRHLAVVSTHTQHFFYTNFLHAKALHIFTCLHRLRVHHSHLVRRSLLGVLTNRLIRSCILGNGFSSNRHTAENFVLRTEIKSRLCLHLSNLL